jgi:hypothetical protein
MMARKRSKHPADEGGEARLAVNLPTGLHRQLKARAAAEGTSIRDYILELLRKNGIR